MTKKVLSFHKAFRALLLPTIFLFLWLLNVISLNALKLSIICFIIVFVILPLFFKYSVFVQKKIIFLNFVSWPKAELENPSIYGLNGVRNFYIDYYSNSTKSEIKLGVWHLLPEVYQNDTLVIDAEETSKGEVFEHFLIRGNKPIILYVHGNAYNRAVEHRRELYEILQKLQYHVIAFDYRGYGDSSDIDVSEIGAVEDTAMVYGWILEKLSKSKEGNNIPIYIWGHSLGSGISAHSFALISKELSISNDKIANFKQPNGIILESPFNNLSDELRSHFTGKAFSWLPWFDWMIIKAIEDSNLTFSSDRYLTCVTSPIMILHAKDDFIVPYKLGLKLYVSVTNDRRLDYGKVEFKSFASTEGLGHKFICRSRILPHLISQFVDEHHSFIPPRITNVNESAIFKSGEENILLSRLL